MSNGKTVDKPFQLLIKPVGADCNLRCAYCFYLPTAHLYPGETPKRMPDDILETITGGLLEHRFPQTVFAWQGGEPTLAGLDFFRRVVACEQRLGKGGQSVGNTLQTNGVLLDDEWCRFLHQYRFLIGLSLDGPKEIHDLHRRAPGGRSAWELVMDAARLMDKHEVLYNILCVIHRDNAGMGADLARWFVQQGFRHLQFIPCVEPGQPLNVTPEAYGAFLCDVFDYWIREGVERVSIRDFEALIAACINHPAGLCTYGRRCNHYLVIEHNGDVYPCDFFVREEWRLGNVMEHPLEWFMRCETHKRFAKLKHNVPACAGCPWRGLCNGGCIKDRMAGQGVSSPSPLCPAYKMFFRHAEPRLRELARRVARRQQRHPASPSQ